MEWMRRPDIGARISMAARAGVVYAAGAIFAITLSRNTGNVAAIWISNAILVGWILRSPRRDTTLLIAAGFAGNLTANLLTATPSVLSLGYALVNTFEVTLAVAGMRFLRLDPSKPVDERVFFLGVGIAVFAAPTAGAALGALLTHMQSGAPVWSVFANWWAGDALGMLTILAVIWTYSASEARELLHGRRALEFWLWVAVMLVVSYVAMDILTHPFVVVGLPLLLAAYRLSLFGTTLINLWTIAAIMGSAVLARNGWLPHPGPDYLSGLGVAQRGFYCLATIVGPLLISVVMSQRAARAARLKLVSDQLRFVTDNLPAMIAYKDAQLRYQFVNNKFSVWYGIREEDILGRTAREAFGPMSDPSLMDALDARMALVMAGATQHTEASMSDGRELEVQYEPHREADKIVGCFVMAQDVSWRKQNERRFQQLLESAPDAMVIADRDGNIVLANAQMGKVFGYDNVELLGKPIEILIPDDLRHGHPALRKEFMADPRPRTMGQMLELRARRKDGSEFPIEVSLSPIHTDEGLLVASAIRDVTERKAVQHALHESKERIEVTLKSIGDAVVTCDRDERVTLLNPIAEDMTGWSHAEALGQPFEEVVRMVDVESGDPPLSPLRIAMEENRIVGLQVNTSLERRDGMRSPIEDSAAPIHDRDGNVVGGVMVFHDVSESRAMALKMSHLAQHDYLTDLPNRVLLQDRLTQALTGMAQGGQGALLFVDLDHFKTINDSLGHQVGDRVLQQVAHRLMAAIRPDDTVSRQGGDEFVLLLTRLHDPRDAARVAEKLIESMREPFDMEGHQLHIGLSIGIALYPQDSSDPRTLMKQADTALYHAKQAGRARYSYFTASMSERAEQRLRMESDLRRALKHDELFLVYQPKVMHPSGRITGMEALVRWRTPDGQVVPPMDFIPVAEESGLITLIDAWVMREACRQNKAWQSQGAPLVPVSVNVSLGRFDPDHLLTLVADVLRTSELLPHCLEIEFTESQMFADEERAWRLIEGLRTLQVRIAVDDFGTGFSNLRYLARYHFDTIKIDQSFVRDLPEDHKQDAVVQAIIAMARALNARVVAEGVETAEQASRLTIHGCREVQGYLYSPPLDAHAFGPMLQLRTVAIPVRATDLPAA